MEARAAATHLYEKLSGHRWLTSVGVTQEGDPCLVVYVSVPPARVAKDIPQQWEGFPVVPRKLGHVSPA
jgi:hypothetical protein